MNWESVNFMSIFLHFESWRRMPSQEFVNKVAQPRVTAILPVANKVEEADRVGGPFGTFWDPLALFGTLWDYLGPLGTIFREMATDKRDWTEVDPQVKWAMDVLDWGDVEPNNYMLASVH